MRSLTAMLASLSIATGLAFTAADALALDRVTTKAGRVVEGEIQREVDGAVWIRTSTGQVEFFSTSDVESIERDISSTPAPAKPSDSGTTGEATPATEAPAPAGQTAPGEGLVSKSDDPESIRAAKEARLSDGENRGAIITLGDAKYGHMVGLQVTAETIRRAIPMLEKDRVDVVVLRVHSGGGALIEIQRVSDLIEYELKPRFRTVAWIETAISAAAMISHTCNEIYFMSNGNYGACTGFSGNANAMKGRGLLEVLYQMEKISERGGHNPLIMRAMQISARAEDIQPLEIGDLNGALSATIDENGDVQWFNDTTTGKHVVNPSGGLNILTFTSQSAEKFKFSRGTADTVDELAKLMGYQEFTWVGETVPGFNYPISRAEKMQVDFRRKTQKDEDFIGQYWASYQMNIQAATAAQDRQERGKFVNRARGELNNIVGMVKNNPNHALFTLNMLPEQFENWIEEQQRLLKELMR
ncbi:MAG: hypothetical protein SFZ23_04950 [Planctomycetota bacterium]|nr:hypothetical protein [Planctomycetota bacterium]